MAIFGFRHKEFYCAFCKSARKIRGKKHIGKLEITLSLSAALVLMFMFFQNFDFRVIPILAIFLCLFEFMIQIQYRLSLTCTECGFDPILYMRSQEKACEQVVAHLEARKNNPATMLSSRPKLDLPNRPTDKQKEKQKKALENKRRLDLRL